MNGTDLRTVFDTIANHDAPPSTVDISQAIRRGGRNRRIRHLATGVTALSVSAALVSLVFVMRPTPRPSIPVVTPTGTSASSSTAPSPTTNASASLPLLIGTVVRFPDGHELTLSTGSADEIGSAIATPGGVVFTAYDSSGAGTVWWQTDAGPATKVTTSNGNFSVSPDGKTLVVSDAAGHPSRVAAYALPSRASLGTIEFTAPALGPVVLNISGDWVLIGSANGSPAPGPALAWNLHTGYHQQLWSDGTAWPIGITETGRVIARYDTRSGKNVTRACYRVRAVTDIVAGRASSGGHCVNSPSDAVPTSQNLSPDGRWLVFPSGSLATPGLRIMAVDDINSSGATGRVLASGPASADLWTSTTTFLARDGIIQPDGSGWWTCDLDGVCTRLSIGSDFIPVPVTGP
jgi:hypothetical protein